MPRPVVKIMQNTKIPPWGISAICKQKKTQILWTVRNSFIVPMPNIGAQKMCVSNEKCYKQTEPLKSETFKIS